MTAMTARAVTPAPGATLRALAAVEARRYARHPAVPGRGGPADLADGDDLTQDAAGAVDGVSATLVDLAILPAFTLGLLGVFVGVHLTRSMARSSEPIEASPTDGVNRVAAMCLACLVPGVVALVWFAWTYAVTAVWPVPATAMPSSSIAAIRAAGIVCAVGGPLFGVMVGRWTRFPGAGLLAAFVLFGWVMLSTGALAMSASRVSTLVHVCGTRRRVAVLRQPHLRGAVDRRRFAAVASGLHHRALRPRRHRGHAARRVGNATGPADPGVRPGLGPGPRQPRLGRRTQTRPASRYDAARRRLGRRPRCVRLRRRHPARLRRSSPATRHRSPTCD